MLKNTVISLLAVPFVIGTAYAEESKKPAEIKCSFNSCTAKNGFTADMIKEFQKKDTWGKSNKKLTLNNVSNEDLKRLPALQGQIEELVFWDASPDLTDISPLAKLSKMKKLRLGNLDGVKDISPLAKAKSLEDLTLYVLRNLTDLKPLGKIKGLQKLEMTVLGAPINLDPVGKLTGLKELQINQSVSYTNFNFIKPLKNIEKLTFLAEPKDVTDISPFAGKTKLKELSFSGAAIVDISMLKDSTELEKLSLSGAKVTDLSVLTSFKKLTSLDLGYIKTPNLDLTPVGELSELTYLDLTNVSASDFKPLAKCTKLEILEATKDSAFFDLDAIKSLPNLKRLLLSSNKSIQKWDALAEMKALESLNVSNTSFTDLKIIANLNNLNTLNVSKNTLTNPEAIATLPKLKSLSVYGATGIPDVSIFQNLAQVTRLYVNKDKDQYPQAQLDVLKNRKDVENKLKKLAKEEFKDNRKQWSVGDGATATTTVADEKYTIEHKLENNSWLSLQAMDIDTTKDFLIETTLSKLSGANNYGYGMLWGAKDGKNYFLFHVSGTGSYAIAKSTDKEWLYRTKWTPSAYVNKNDATNKLSVKKLGTHVKFYINDRYVSEMAFEEFSGNKLGFMVNGKMKIAVEEVLVKN